MSEKTSGGKYDDLIVQDLKHDPPMSPEFRAIYQKFASRILWIDGNVVPGAFQMNTSWYKAVPEIDPIFAEHSHHSAEILGFFGTNPDDPYDLGAEIEVDIDGEPHILTRTSMVFIPPDLPHTLHIRRVDRPIFHFSVVTESTYNGSAYK